MQCPRCHSENPEAKKFCRKCGAKFLLNCPQCNYEILPNDLFCGECGQNLAECAKAKDESAREIEGERKYVSALFADLSGYTTISEKLDPEEVKKITSRIFGYTSKIVSKYEGFIEKYAGDAMMALFGVPKAHEDDPIRAIKAAREMHDFVRATSPEMENKIGQPLSMHTGINTGLVVTGELDMEQGSHGIVGDTINIASRLSSLAKDGEILIGRETYRQAEGHFKFETLDPATVKGKAKPIQIYKVLSSKEKPITVHRLSGVRADLVGRKAELAELCKAVNNLSDGKGSIFSISGSAGIGKSRLVEEFKATLDIEKIQWVDGHAYPYAQNIPYFPIIDLLNRVLKIEENDDPERIKRKIEFELEQLVGKQEDIVPYIGGLYSINYPEVEDVSPEFWKSRLQKAIQEILSALAKRASTIFFLEDLHWADPSFVDLLRNALLSVRQPAIVLCVYRPTFNLFSTQQLRSLGKLYHEIRLINLSPSDTRNMMKLLLKTESIPYELNQLVRDKSEGNPFYLEELINSFIESEVLIQENGDWKIARSITEKDMSASIQGLISVRLDRLEKEAKRIIQEASVIGRAFLYDLLQKITEINQGIHRSIKDLEGLNFIRVRAFEPDLEYIFKHALTQEVAYNGLLKEERRKIHERIGLVIEKLFRHRLPEFYEALAFHFTRSQSINKAIYYLMKSGDKSLRRYAIEESHQYFKDAFNILSDKRMKTREDEKLIIDILLQWAYVFNHRGDFRGLANLFSAHEDIARSLDDKERLGMFYACLGWALNQREKLRDAFNYLSKALKLGEETENQKVIGYACAWITWTCASLGLLDEAINYAERAQKTIRFQKSDKELFRFTMGGMATTYMFRGESTKEREAGKVLLEYGQRESDLRCMTQGYIFIGYSYYVAGCFSSAIEYHMKAIQIASDPLFVNLAKLALGIAYMADGQLEESEKMFREAKQYSENLDAEIIGSAGRALYGIIMITKGQLTEGVKIVEDLLRIFQENESRYRYVTGNYLLGKFYLQMFLRTERRGLSFLRKNIGFLLKNVPFAAKKAEEHFNIVINVAEEIGAKGILGQAKLDLGMLYKAKNKSDIAREYISSAIQLFKECEAEVYLNRATDTLSSLN
jgi:class 3 adenylate cyclase/tetratricopeptide (TPR) repeat protein